MSDDATYLLCYYDKDFARLEKDRDFLDVQYSGYFVVIETDDCLKLEWEKPKYRFYEFERLCCDECLESVGGDDFINVYDHSKASINHPMHIYHLIKLKIASEHRRDRYLMQLNQVESAIESFSYSKDFIDRSLQAFDMRALNDKLNWLISNMDEQYIPFKYLTPEQKYRLYGNSPMMLAQEAAAKALMKDD